MEKNEIWKPIIGYPNYEISDKAQVRNIKRGHILKYRTHGGCVKVRLSKDGHCRTFSIHNIMLAAKYKVDPDKTKGIYFVSDEKGERYITKDEYCRMMTERSSKSRKCTEDQMMRTYDETKHMIDLIQEYYKTGDIGKVTSYVEAFKDEVIAYMYKNQFTCSRERAEEYWSIARELVLSGVVNKNKAIITPGRYLKSIVRKQVFQMRSMKRNTLSFDEKDYL